MVIFNFIGWCSVKKKFMIFFVILSFLHIFAGYDYIFLFIGDGMGINQVTLADMYKKSVFSESLNMLNLKNFSLVKTNSLNTVTDSAAAITSIMSFEKTYNEKINIDKNGFPLSPITYYLKDMKYKIAGITTTTITDATIAGLFSRVSDRKNNSEIFQQMIKSNFDLFIGGGRAFLKKEEIEKNNYSYDENIPDNVNSKNEIISMAYSNMPFTIDASRVSLSEMLSYTLEKFGSNKFFIMTEGGRIDHAAHAHDSLTMIKEIIDFDDAVGKAIKFAEVHENTLIIVTADHETGGLSLGDGFINISNLSGQKVSYEKFISIYNQSSDYDKFISETGFRGNLKDLYSATDKNIVYTSDIVQTFLNYYNSKAGLKWSTFGHTANYVPLYSNRNIYDSYIIDNTEILWKIIEK